MKITKLFKLLFFSSFLYLLPSYAQKNLPNRYRDTAISLENYSVKLKDTYVKKNLFLRTTVEINNRSDQFMLINPKDILFSTEKLVDKHCLYNKTIVVPPHYTIKFYLKFSGGDCKSKFATLNFTKLRFSNDPHPIDVYKKIKVTGGTKYKNDTLSFVVAGIEVLPKEYVVEIKLKHKGYKLNGDKFLAINFNSIGIYSEKTDTCYNLKKTANKFHYNPGVKRETYKLLFSRKCVNVDGKRKFLTFKNVFTEYTLTNSEGFKMTLLSADENEASFISQKNEEIEAVD